MTMALGRKKISELPRSGSALSPNNFSFTSTKSHASLFNECGIFSPAKKCNSEAFAP